MFRDRAHFEEELAKASSDAKSKISRIKEGVRKKHEKKDSNDKETIKQINNLLNSKHVPESVKRRLKDVHGQITKEQSLKRPDNYKSAEEITAAREDKKSQQAKESQQVKDFVSSNKPRDYQGPASGSKNPEYYKVSGTGGARKLNAREKEQLKHLELAHAKLKSQGAPQEHLDAFAKEISALKAPQQTMRSKAAGKLSGPVKQAMATGEGIAIPDKSYGAALDTQQKLKTAQEKIDAESKPVETIRVPKKGA